MAFLAETVQTEELDLAALVTMMMAQDVGIGGITANSLTTDGFSVILATAAFDTSDTVSIPTAFTFHHAQEALDKPAIAAATFTALRY